MNTGKSNIAKRIFGIVTIPVGTLLVFYLICAFRGIAFFETSNHVLIFCRTVATVTLTTFALSINLDSGRFDFSLGSIALLASVIGSTVASQHGFTAIGMLAITLAVGLLLGAFSGLVYVVLKLPAIITSLGVTLMYEAGAFIFTGGFGVSFTTNTELTTFSNSITNMIVVTVVALVFVIVVFNYTKFGYDYYALKNGQKVALNTGVKEKVNAIVCYTIAGTMMSMVGYINASLTGTIQMSMNFSSITAMFTAFLPLFIGGFIGRFSENHFGMVLGSATFAIISLGFVRLGLSSEAQAMVSAVVLVAFLIYLNNEHSIIALVTGKRKSNS